MSANPQRTAQAFDVAPARVLSLVERQAGADTSTVADDLADGVEAVHQIANLAGFSQRPRAFILALATAAHSRGAASVELFDAELAELQNCSDKTVQRQRADYQSEVLRLRTIDLVGIEEGEYDRVNDAHAPTRYTFHLAGTVERIVADARSDPRWHELDRKGQRELLKQAAARAYELIPDSKRKRRRRKRPRLAAALLETHRKSIDTHMRKLREVAARLPAAERERLFDDPGELREWWLKVRAEMDELCGVDSPQTVTSNDLRGDSGHFVHHPLAEDSEPAEPDPAAVAAWERLTDRLSQSAVRTVEVELQPPEYPPGELTYEVDEDALREAEAVRAEGCGELLEVE